MQLVNLQTGKPEDVADDVSVSALAAGTHVPVGSKALIDPNGELVYSPMSDAGKDISNGYRIPTQAELTELSKQQKYGTGAGNVAKAFGEGALRGGTFGAGTYLEQAMGVSPEAIAERSARNPIASTTGEVTGAGLSALVAPELSPAGLVGKLGAGISERLAPEALGEGASLASRILNASGQIGAQAAGSAVEGAFYGAGKAVHESALGDPDLTAQKVMAHIGMGAFLGGTLGGLVKAGELAAPKIGNAAIDAIEAKFPKDVEASTPSYEEELAAKSKPTPEAEEAAPASASKLKGVSATDIYSAVMAATGHPWGLIASVAKRAIDPQMIVNRLGGLERIAQKSSDLMERAGEVVFKPTVTLASAAVGPVAGELSAAEQTKQYEKQTKQIEEYNTAPQKAIDKLDLATQDIYHVAPQIGQALQQAAIRGTEFLSTKIPRPATPRMPFDKPFAPSRVQMLKFNRYYNVVHRPLTALSDLQAGKVAPETVEALQTVYPQLYTEMKTSLINSMAKAVAKGVELPMQKRMAISQFIGQPIDSSSQSFQANQQVIAQQAAGKQAAQKALHSTAKGVGNLTVSDRMKTNIQGSAQRG